jgi:hypothetical protein
LQLTTMALAPVVRIWRTAETAHQSNSTDEPMQ